MMPTSIQKYANMMTRYLEGSISAEAFEGEFLEMYKSDETQWSEQEFLLLERLFGTVDALCLDPDLFDEGDLNEAQFQQECQDILKNMMRLPSTRATN